MKNKLQLNLISAEKAHKKIDQLTRAIDALSACAPYLENELDHNIEDIIDELRGSAAHIEEALEEYYSNACE